MNTFNMKQWLTENKVGPYAKTSINESHEGNEQWLERFYDVLQGLKMDQWIKKQIMNIPSHDLISMYDETTPEMALKDIVKKMFHSARESKQPVAEKQQVGGGDKVSEFEFSMGDDDYIADLYVNWTGDYTQDGDFDVKSVDIEIIDLAKGVGDTYVAVTDENEKATVKKALESDPQLEKELSNYVDWSGGEPMYDEPERDLDEESTDEQIGVGYASITKPSDPKY